MSTEAATPQDKNPFQPRINAIRKMIYSEDKRLREKYTWLEQQNILGAGCFVTSLLAIAVTAYLYTNGALAWYFTIPLMGIFVSILHEIEHDLIHDMYFKETKWVQNLMFAVIWIAKLNANPWWRKPMHLKHHKTSGQVDDIEERLIGLGEPIGIKRFFTTISPLGVYLLSGQVTEDSRRINSLPGLNIHHASLVNLPVLLPAHIAFGVLFFPSLIPAFYYNLCWNVCMLMFFPNMLRQACLVIVSTGVHYYGDIPEKNVFFQNQVLNHWLFYPMQAFCFNFGETHILHHYVSRQPFYLRQMCSPGVMSELRKQGVRFNDLEIYARAHRYYKKNGSNDGVTSLAVGA